MDPSEVFTTIFSGLNRLAPGSDASTRRALTAVQRHRDPRYILDAGCGTGASTLVLLRETAAAITAVDVERGSLRTLEERAKLEIVNERLTTQQASIAELPCAPESFDLIWSEGAIYTIGFDAGLRAWRSLLTPGGFVVCSELTWLTNTPSEATRAFWAEGFPAMRNEWDNITAAESLGYACVESFALPDTDWTEEYYGPLAERLTQLSTQFTGDKDALDVVAGIEREIALFRDHGNEYGYVFYLLQKTG